MNTFFTALINAVVEILLGFSEQFDDIWNGAARVGKAIGAVKLQPGTLDSDDEPFFPDITYDDSEDPIMQLYMTDMLDHRETPDIDSIFDD